VKKTAKDLTENEEKILAKITHAFFRIVNDQEAPDPDSYFLMVHGEGQGVIAGNMPIDDVISAIDNTFSHYGEVH